MKFDSPQRRRERREEDAFALAPLRLCGEYLHSLKAAPSVGKAPWLASDLRVVGLVARKRAPTSAFPVGLWEPACGRRAGHRTRIAHGQTIPMPGPVCGNTSGTAKTALGYVVDENRLLICEAGATAFAQIAAGGGADLAPLRVITDVALAGCAGRCPGASCTSSSLSLCPWGRWSVH